MSVMTAQSTTVRRAVSNTLKGSAGNLVEWYDVYVYSVFASYFEAQFFDTSDTQSGLYIWAIFAVTFLMRPFGSWFFGRFADRHGRRRSLTLSVSVMAACSLLIAVTPTAESIGGGAVIVLVCARLLQGFATGGEYGTSATYLSEAAVPGHRGFLASFHYVTLVGGHVLAQLTLLIMVSTLTPEAVAEWGWRVAFLIGGAGAVVVLWMRRTMDETLQCEPQGGNKSAAQIPAGSARADGSMRALLGQHWRRLLLCMLITSGGTVAFYTYSVNGPMIVKQAFTGEDLIAGTVTTLIALIVLMIMQPIGGLISDSVGRKTLLVFFGTGAVLYSWVLIMLLPSQKNPVTAFAMLVLGFVILTGYTSINAVVKAELFPAHIRALGVGFGYAIANSIFGGTAPLLYRGAVATEQVPLFTGYVTAIIGLSLLVYIFCLKNRGLNWLDNADELQQRARSQQRTVHR